jgi:hypothetical protein
VGGNSGTCEAAPPDTLYGSNGGGRLKYSPNAELRLANNNFTSSEAATNTSYAVLLELRMLVSNWRNTNLSSGLISTMSCMDNVKNLLSYASNEPTPTAYWCGQTTSPCLWEI